MTKLKLFWAVFDEHGAIWIYTVRRTRADAIASWLKEGGYRDAAAKWDYWRRAGYVVGKIAIKRI